jgi:hypothetical protein
MLVVNGTDGNANIDSVAFGDSVFDLENVLREHDSVVLSGRTAMREDNSVSLFVDSIIPIEEWVASSAQKITLSVADKNRLPELKGVLDPLSNGLAKVVIKINDGGKEAVLLLPRGVRLGPDTMKQLSSLGIKAEIE